jgi:simple sugar transport system substrate-binding protein
VRNGVETAAKETDSDVEYLASGQFDLPAMSKLIDAAVASKPDALVVSIPDAAPLSKSIQAAVAAKIPVISINSGFDVSKKLGCLMHIGQEEESAGRQAGERMKAMGVRQALILNQEVGNVALDQRTKGFRDGFEGPFHHVQVLPVKLDFMECYDAVTASLQENQEIDGILALGPVAAEPALQAVDTLGKVGKIKVCTFDISPRVIQALIKKQMGFALDQQQWLQGYLPVIFLANYIKKGSMPQNSVILTGPSFVTPENVEQAAHE